jgi:hypothetical protein
MPNRKNAPTKPELAQFKALSDMGHSQYAISKLTGRDRKTIRRYLLRSDLYQDPEVQKMIEAIKAEELADLTLLNAKARLRLHERLDEDKLKNIELIAAMDRSFSQVRLLRGQSTMNMATFHADIQAVKELMKRKEACKAESD